MVDTKLSALPAAAGLADTDVLYLTDGVTSEKVSLNQLITYFESRARQTNASVADQTPAVSTAVYLAGSNVTIPTGRLQAKSMYRLRFNATKTATGTTAATLDIRTGTAGTVTDTSRTLITFGAQTAVADEAMFEVYANFRTVGSGTSTVLRTIAVMNHRLPTTGFSTAGANDVKTGLSSGFDSTTAGLQIGAVLNTGAGVWTINLVQAELFNLA